MNTLTLVDTGEKISFISASIRGDIDNFSYDVSIEVESYDVYQRLRPTSGQYTPIIIDAFSNQFHLLIERSDGNGRSWSVDTEGKRSESYTLTARSYTALLDAPHAKPISKEWTNTTAKTIVQELCDVAGVVMDFAVTDWPLKFYSVSKVLPIEIIIELVGAKGILAIVLPTLDGKLKVCKRDKVSPDKYQANAPDHIIDEHNHLFSLSESFDERGKYGSVLISNEDTSEQLRVNFETIEDNGDVIVKAFVVPFQDIDFEHAGLSYISALYEGIHEEIVTDEVQFIDGKGSVSKPFYELIGINWFYSDLGSVTITENGEVIATIPGHSLADITYKTKFHRYRVQPMNNAVKTLVFTETEIED